MTDNEITIKALKELLEVMLCEGDLQRVSTVSHAIEHINRQKAEIERLKKDSKRLKKVQMQLDDLCKMHHIIKAEAYKECIDKIKNELRNIAKIDWQDNYYYLVGTAFFDNILMEMEGENDGIL